MSKLALLRSSRFITALFAVCLTLGITPTAHAAPSPKKAIWGPARVDGRSQFPIYRDLGVGIYQAALNWSAIAPTRPAHPTDPNDPAYHWPAEETFAVSEAKRYGIRVSLQLVSLATLGERWSLAANGLPDRASLPTSLPPPPGDIHRCGTGWYGVSPPVSRTSFLCLPTGRRDHASTAVSSTPRTVP